MSSNLVRRLVQRCWFQRVEIISCFLIIQYFFPGAAKAPQSLQWPLHHRKLRLFPVTSCSLVETVQPSQTSHCSTHTSSDTDFTENILLFSCNDASGFSLLLVSKLTVIRFRAEAALHRFPWHRWGEKQLSRFTSSPSPLSYSVQMSCSIIQMDSWANKLAANSCGHSSGRKEPSASASACLSSQVLLGWNQLRAPVLTHQRDHLQVRMKTRFPSARVLQHKESCWGIWARLDVFSSKLKHYSP